MPVVVKTWFAERLGLMMGIYTGVIGLSGSIGGLTAVPLARAFGGYEATMLAWAVAAVAGLVLAAPLYFPPAGCGGMRFSRPIIGYFPRGGGGGAGRLFSRLIIGYFPLGGGGVTGMLFSRPITVCFPRGGGAWRGGFEKG